MGPRGLLGGHAADRRDPLYSEIPTLREQGVDLAISSWHGLFAPKGTPAAVIDRLDKALAALSQKREFINQMTTQLLGVRYMNRSEFERFFADQDAQFKRIIDKLDINPNKKGTS